jgi:3-dehydroquinate dehydratase/shikimate dehydrogenase
MIIVSITGPSMRDAAEQVRRSSLHADMFEFRLDGLHRPDLVRLLALTNKPRIVTCRPRWEGGAFTGSDEARLEILLLAAFLGAEYVDYELEAGSWKHFLRRRGGTKLIVSKHFYSGPPASPRGLYRRMRAVGADVIKLAYAADDAADIGPMIEFLDLARRDRQRAIVTCMGEAGEASRVLYRKLGGWATYAAPEIGQPSARGQVRGSELKRLYRADRLNRNSRVYGVVGNPVRQSKGVYVHNSILRSRNGVYCRFPVVNLGRFMKSVGGILKGFSVTLPWKEAIVNHLDRVDPIARRIGAVNTVVRRSNGLWGTNTDAPGALDAIEGVVRVAGKRVLVIGGGGAARAIVFEAQRRGAHVIVANRTGKKAKRLAAEYGCVSVPMKDLRKATFDVLVNATAVGMAPDTGKSPVPATILRRGTVVFDAVYNPPITRLLREARDRGGRIITGIEMYLNQAARQSRLFTGRRPDIAKMRSLLLRHLEAEPGGRGRQQ